ncbi:DUF6431 domain-containing protein [Streptomyces sp. NPDC052396]|uniref:DUF6431 domain-containing protein n=1 Tax=Streptomyces sp. NPDC052396 TaxID=3365689 RepID=UPI0037D620CD
MRCPRCGAALAPWGYGRRRQVRGAHGARLSVRPRRARCSKCATTHVLLADSLWPRRADTAEVIGTALELSALGMGHRKIAARLGRAEGTVRGWIRRFARRAKAIHRFFSLVVAVRTGVPAHWDTGNSPDLDAVLAVVAAYLAAVRQGGAAGASSWWRFAGRVTGGRLLACAASKS